MICLGKLDFKKINILKSMFPFIGINHEDENIILNNEEQNKDYDFKFISIDDFTEEEFNKLNYSVIIDNYAFNDNHYDFYKLCEVNNWGIWDVWLYSNYGKEEYDVYFYNYLTDDYYKCLDELSNFKLIESDFNTKEEGIKWIDENIKTPKIW